MPGFVVLARLRGDGDDTIRCGITVSKKVDTRAVVRNRMKRRFRELTRALLCEYGVPGADHVLIGRGSGVERDWASLQADFVKACAKLRRDLLPAGTDGRSVREDTSPMPHASPPRTPPLPGRGTA